MLCELFAINLKQKKTKKKNNNNSYFLAIINAYRVTRKAIWKIVIQDTSDDAVVLCTNVSSVLWGIDPSHAFISKRVGNDTFQLINNTGKFD